MLILSRGMRQFDVAHVGKLQRCQEHSAHLKLRVVACNVCKIDSCALLLLLLGFAQFVEDSIAVNMDVEWFTVFLLFQEWFELLLPVCHSLGQLRLPRVFIYSLHKVLDMPPARN